MNARMNARMNSYIGFSVARGFWSFLSQIIRWVSGSPVSHVWIAYDDPVFGCRMVMEAHSSGLRVITWRHFIEENTIKYLFAPKSDLTIGLQNIAAKLGTSYDYLGLLGMTWVELGKRLRRRWKNPFHSSKEQFCSEVVCRILITSEYPGITVLPEECDPVTLLRLFLRDGSEIIHSY